MKKFAREKALSRNQYLVPALYRGLKIIELLAQHPQGLTIAGMQKLKLPGASIYRMLMTLLELDYVTRDEGDVYRLSRKILSLGYKTIDESGLIEKSRPTMRQLRDLCGESVLLAVLYGHEGVVIDEVASNQAVKVTVQIGHHFPLHTAAPGKAILAFLPDDERKRIVNSIVYTTFTPQTLKNAAELNTELATIRSQGVAFDRGEEIEDIRCISAPVFNHQNYPIAAISCGGPASRLPENIMRKHTTLVKDHAARISAKFN